MAAKKKVAAETKFEHREAWLQAGVDQMSERFGEQFAHHFGDEFTETKIKASCGFPRNDRNGKVVGQCWPGGRTADGTRHVFITPLEDDPIEVLGTLLHEMIHAYDNCVHQHRGVFVRACRAVGLAGKPTATTVGADLKPILTEIVADLGAYPHTKMVVGAKVKVQSTRMLKMVCAAPKPSEFIVRMTQKWLDEYGAPLCACHEKKMLTEQEWMDRVRARLARAAAKEAKA